MKRFIYLNFYLIRSDENLKNSNNILNHTSNLCNIVQK